MGDRDSTMIALLILAICYVYADLFMAMGGITYDDM